MVDGEHKVFVTDANTLKLINTIDMTSDAMLGAEGGAHPRRITGDSGKVYVSTYGGYVAAIDTVSFSLKQKYQVGSYPEGLVVSNGTLYVANSDYGMGQNPSISKIDLRLLLPVISSITSTMVSMVLLPLMPRSMPVSIASILRAK